MEKFWMVIIDGRFFPVARHSTYNSAYGELQRLTMLTKSRGYILEAVGSSEYVPPAVPEGTARIFPL